MPQPFNFEHVLFLHSGLTGWLLKVGDPEKFVSGKAVKYVLPATKTADEQVARFTLSPENTVDLFIGDQHRIVGLDMAYMKIYALPDSEIDTSDIPETTDWSKAERGKFYREKPEI